MRNLKVMRYYLARTISFVGDFFKIYQAAVNSCHAYGRNFIRNFSGETSCQQGRISGTGRPPGFSSRRNVEPVFIAGRLLML